MEIIFCGYGFIMYQIRVCMLATILSHSKDSETPILMENMGWGLGYQLKGVFHIARVIIEI